jgi:hypothetical protein
MALYAYMQYWIEGPRTYFAVAEPTCDGQYTSAFRVRTLGATGLLHQVSAEAYDSKEAAIEAARALLEDYFGLCPITGKSDSSLAVFRWPAERGDPIH